MATAETKAQIEHAIASFQHEVPALARLKLVVELELRGRGDIQLFRVEVPGPKILATPMSVSFGMSASGMMPPTSTRTCSRRPCASCADV